MGRKESHQTNKFHGNLSKQAFYNKLVKQTYEPAHAILVLITYDPTPLLNGKGEGVEVQRFDCFSHHNLFYGREIVYVSAYRVTMGPPAKCHLNGVALAGR